VAKALMFEAVNDLKFSKELLSERDEQNDARVELFLTDKRVRH